MHAALADFWNWSESQEPGHQQEGDGPPGWRSQMQIPRPCPTSRTANPGICVWETLQVLSKKSYWGIADLQCCFLLHSQVTQVCVFIPSFHIAFHCGPSRDTECSSLRHTLGLCYPSCTHEFASAKPRLPCLPFLPHLVTTVYSCISVSLVQFCR